MSIFYLHPVLTFNAVESYIVKANSFMIYLAFHFISRSHFFDCIYYYCSRFLNLFASICLYLASYEVGGESLELGLNPSPFLDWFVTALYFCFVAAINVDNGFLYWQDGFSGLAPFYILNIIKKKN